MSYLFRCCLFLFSFSAIAFTLTDDKALPAAPNVSKKPWNASIHGHFLYWQAAQSGMAFCKTFRKLSSEEQSVANHFDPGYKVGFSLYPNFENTDLTFRFTWFNQPGRMRSYIKDNQLDCLYNEENKICNIEPPFDNYFDGPLIFFDNILTSSKSIWGLQISEGDLELGRRYKVSRQLYLRPMIGLKALWQKQSWNIYYNNTIDIGAYKLSANENFFLDQHSIGIGPRVGCDIKYKWSKNFAFSGNSAFSVVSSRFKNTMLQETSFSNILDFSNASISKKISNSQPVLEMGLGLAFDRYYMKDAYHIGSYLGWEFQYLGDNNNFIVTRKDYRNGTLSIQGVNFKVQFDF